MVGSPALLRLPLRSTKVAVVPRLAVAFRKPAPHRFYSPKPVSETGPAVTNTSQRPSTPPHLLTLADLSISQIQSLVSSAINFKKIVRESNQNGKPHDIHRLLDAKTIALIFGKRSTRTRVASESATALLGGHPMFLSPSDIQLGVNESLYDTAKVVGSMVDGIMARVGDHSDVELLAANSAVPVVNALSSLYHPTQILADLVTLLETFFPHSRHLSSLNGLNVTWIGDSNNILNDMIVAYPRLGINLKIATPHGYALEPRVLERMEQGIQEDQESHRGGKLVHTHDPLEAVQDADVLVTDTWISMGQEAEMARRLKDFAGFQITEQMCRQGKAKSDWKFMHCLPRHPDEVDDEVFYGPRSLVFPEAENRKWTILSVFEAYFGRWMVRLIQYVKYEPVVKKTPDEIINSDLRALLQNVSNSIAEEMMHRYRIQIRKLLGIDELNCHNSKAVMISPT